MASELEVARMLAGRDRAETHPGTAGSVTIAGTALEDSSGGSVLVDLGGETVSEDGTQPVTVPATVDVRAGDVVRVTLDGVPGSGRRPTVTGVVGGGDRTRTDVDNAVSDASQAVNTAGKAADDAATAKQSADAAMTEAKDAKSTATDASEAAHKAQADAESTNTELSHTRSSFEASIVTLTKRADDVDQQAQDTAKTLSDEVEVRRSFFRLLEQSGLPTLELGSTSSPAMVHLTNEQLQFLYNQVVVAWMSGNELDIRVARIITQLVVGGFAAMPQPDGNLSIKWVGDS